jgi:NADH-quinone oxidoreductase subunit E
MAWITKNSGTMEIERRDEPYLDDALKAELEETFIPRYPTRQAATLPVLHAIQHKHGYLPFQAIEEAAAFLQLTPSVVLDTATFYDEFFFEPVGKYVVWVCQSISCELMGHKQLIERLTEKLGIEMGQTTADGRITLKHVECLGSCGSAPCALVSEKLHENLTADNLDRIIDALE